MHNSTLFDRRVARATGAQSTQLFPQADKFCDTFVDMRDVLVQQRVNGAASDARLVRCGQQRSNFIVRHVKRAAVSYEAETVDVGGSVVTIVRLGPLRRRE